MDAWKDHKGVFSALEGYFFFSCYFFVVALEGYFFFFSCFFLVFVDVVVVGMQNVYPEALLHTEDIPGALVTLAVEGAAATRLCLDTAHKLEPGAGLTVLLQDIKARDSIQVV